MNEITNVVPQLVNLMERGGTTSGQAETLVQQLLGEYGWLMLAGLFAILAKDVMMNFAQAIMVFAGSSFNNDDIIYISGRQARIVRVGVRSTTFYMTDRKTKMVVPNEQLKQLTIEKTLSQNGSAPYLPKGGDEDFIGFKEVPVPPSPLEVKVVNEEKPPSRKK